MFLSAFPSPSFNAFLQNQTYTSWFRCKSSYCELICSRKSCAVIVRGSRLHALTFLIGWSLTLLQREGCRGRRVADLPRWDYSSLPGRSVGGGMGNTFCHTLIHNLHLSHSCHSLSLSASLWVCQSACCCFCLLLTYTHTLQCCTSKKSG